MGNVRRRQRFSHRRSVIKVWKFSRAKLRTQVSELCPSAYCTLSLRLSNRYTIVRDFLLFFRVGRNFSVCWLRIWNGSGLCLFAWVRTSQRAQTVSVMAVRKCSYKVPGTLFSRKILVTIPNTKFHENTCIGNRVVPNGRTDRQENVPFSVFRSGDLFYSV